MGKDYVIVYCVLNSLAVFSSIKWVSMFYDLTRLGIHQICVIVGNFSFNLPFMDRIYLWKSIMLSCSSCCISCLRSGMTLLQKQLSSGRLRAFGSMVLAVFLDFWVRTFQFEQEGMHLHPQSQYVITDAFNVPIDILA